MYLFAEFLSIMSASTSSLHTAPSAVAQGPKRKPLIISLGLVLIGAIYLLATTGWRQTLLWIVGTLLGVSLYHSQFGFTRAWRVFVSDRRGAGLRAQMFILSLGVLIFFPVLATGSFFGMPVQGLVSPVGMSVILGSFLFGIGMQLGGGCASGTLFAVGGGNTRMIVTLVFFIIGSLIATANFDWWSSLPHLAPISLVKLWGVGPAILAHLAVFGLVAWGVTVAEKRRHGGRLHSKASDTKGPAHLLCGPWSLIWGAWHWYC